MAEAPKTTYQVTTTTGQKVGLTADQYARWVQAGSPSGGMSEILESIREPKKEPTAKSSRQELQKLSTYKTDPKLESQWERKQSELQQAVKSGDRTKIDQIKAELKDLNRQMQPDIDWSKVAMPELPPQPSSEVMAKAIRDETKRLDTKRAELESLRTGVSNIQDTQIRAQAQTELQKQIDRYNKQASGLQTYITSRTIEVGPTKDRIFKQDFDKLSFSEKQRIGQVGVAEFEREQQAAFLRDNVEVRPGEYISRTDWNQLTPRQQMLVKTLGVEGYNKAASIARVLGQAQRELDTIGYSLTPDQERRLGDMGFNLEGHNYLTTIREVEARGALLDDGRIDPVAFLEAGGDPKVLTGPIIGMSPQEVDRIQRNLHIKNTGISGWIRQSSPLAKLVQSEKLPKPIQTVADKFLDFTSGYVAGQAIELDTYGLGYYARGFIPGVSSYRTFTEERFQQASPIQKAATIGADVLGTALLVVPGVGAVGGTALRGGVQTGIRGLALGTRAATVGTSLRTILTPASTTIPRLGRPTLRGTGSFLRESFIDPFRPSYIRAGVQTLTGARAIPRIQPAVRQGLVTEAGPMQLVREASARPRDIARTVTTGRPGGRLYESLVSPEDIANLRPYSLIEDFLARPDVSGQTLREAPAGLAALKYPRVDFRVMGGDMPGMSPGAMYQGGGGFSGPLGPSVGLGGGPGTGFGGGGIGPRTGPSAPSSGPSLRVTQTGLKPTIRPNIPTASPSSSARLSPAVLSGVGLSGGIRTLVETPSSISRSPIRPVRFTTPIGMIAEPLIRRQQTRVSIVPGRITIGDTTVSPFRPIQTPERARTSTPPKIGTITSPRIGTIIGTITAPSTITPSPQPIPTPIKTTITSTFRTTSPFVPTKIGLRFGPTSSSIRIPRGTIPVWSPSRFGGGPAGSRVSRQRTGLGGWETAFSKVLGKELTQKLGGELSIRYGAVPSRAIKSGRADSGSDSPEVLVLRALQEGIRDPDQIAIRTGLSVNQIKQIITRAAKIETSGPSRYQIAGAA